MLKRLCGEGLCGRIAGLLLVTGFAVALAFDGLIAIAGGGVILAGGVLLALTLEDTVAPIARARYQPAGHPGRRSDHTRRVTATRRCSRS
jgi:hypothetical protein